MPEKEELREIDLGIPAYGEEKSLDQDIYERLRSEGKILEKIAPLVIQGILADMEKNGFDNSKPIDVWQGIEESFFIRFINIITRNI